MKKKIMFFISDFSRLLPWANCIRWVILFFLSPSELLQRRHKTKSKNQVDAKILYLEPSGPLKLKLFRNPIFLLGLFLTTTTTLRESCLFQRLLGRALKSMTTISHFLLKPDDDNNKPTSSIQLQLVVGWIQPSISIFFPLLLFLSWQKKMMPISLLLGGFFLEIQIHTYKTPLTKML